MCCQYNHMRTVVVRHENGDLRHADAETADRMMRVYLPSPGQQVVPPKVFEPDVLEVSLNILKSVNLNYDAALCIQTSLKDLGF